MLEASLPRWMRQFDVKVVVGISALIVGLGAVRTLNLWLTDIFVSDEYGYISAAWQRQVFDNPLIGYRTTFAYVNNGIFWLFNLGSTDRLWVLFPFYIALWNLISVLAVWQTLRTLGYQPRTVGLSLIAFVSLPAFLVPSLGFFTEGMALAFASVGLCLLVRYLKEESRVRSSLMLAVSGIAFWLAMHAREPYVLLFLGLGLVPLASALTSKSWKMPAVACLICFVVAYGVINPIQDPIAIETQQSFISFGYPLVMGPLLTFLGLQHPSATTTTTAVSSTAVPAVTTTTTVVTTTYVSGGRTITTTTTMTTTETVATSVSYTTFTFTLPINVTETSPPPPPVQATGILAFLGITTVPDSLLIRSFLLILVSLLAGYGVLVILPVAGTVYLLYEILARRTLRRRLPVVLIALMFGATLTGVTLTFASDPVYFGTQHYSTLLRFASTTLLAFPLLTAPLVGRLANNRKVVLFVLVSIVLIYGVTAPSLMGAAVSGLESYNNPLLFQTPQYAGPTILLRDYVLAHPSSSPFVVMGLDPSLLPWTPGLSARGDVKVMPYQNDTQLTSLALSNFYLFVPPDGLLKMQHSYPALGALASNSLDGNLSAVDGFRPVGIVFDNSYGIMIRLSRS